MSDFICESCGVLRDVHSQAVIVGCKPEDAELWVPIEGVVVAVGRVTARGLADGMPCIFTGFCIICLGDDE